MHALGLTKGMHARMQSALSHSNSRRRPHGKPHLLPASYNAEDINAMEFTQGLLADATIEYSGPPHPHHLHVRCPGPRATRRRRQHVFHLR